MLAWVIERVKRSREADGVVVATTTCPSDEEVERVAHDLGVNCFRGDARDVLLRFVQAAASFNAATVVRISADSPFIDGSVVDTVVGAFCSSTADLVQNHRPAQWPIGTAVEVMTADCLRKLDDCTRDSFDREHVTTYAYRHPAEFDIEFVPAPSEFTKPLVRLCVDTKADLEYARRICRALDGDVTAPLSSVLAAATQ
jgi:spore coat polysaccharide biosynthesis protein SpsF